MREFFSLACICKQSLKCLTLSSNLRSCLIPTTGNDTHPYVALLHNTDYICTYLGDFSNLSRHATAMPPRCCNIFGLVLARFINWRNRIKGHHEWYALSHTANAETSSYLSSYVFIRACQCIVLEHCWSSVPTLIPFFRVFRRVMWNVKSTAGRCSEVAWQKKDHV